MKHPLVLEIDKAFIENHPERDKPFRAHLGGSLIGRKCERELYYSFRWFRRPSFAGRMLRLFDRGHKEEFRFVAYLRSIGINVREYSQSLWYHAESDDYVAIDWADENEMARVAVDGLNEVTGDEFHVKRAKERGLELKQWRILDVMGHFGGSLDGLADAPFPIPILAIRNAQWYDTGEVIPANEEFLTEFKTHNTKSFGHLVLNGVKEAKPVHWHQMQTYMGKRGLRFAMYVAVNKNDDDLHIEIVKYDGGEALSGNLEKAKRVIHARQVPPRIAKNPSFFDCKYCDYVKVCHYGENTLIDRNCRTCKHSLPVDDGRWHCSKWNALIPSDALIKGCDSHSVITD